MELEADAFPMAPLNFPPVRNGELVNRRNNNAEQNPNQNENDEEAADEPRGNRREPICPHQCFMIAGFWTIVFIVSIFLLLFIVLIALKMLEYY